jgi:hypothetical protein
VHESVSTVRLRYPLRAWLLIVVGWSFFVVVMLLCALFMLPLVPLAPALVMIMVALGGLLSSVHEYARSVATPVQTTRLPSRNDGKVPQAQERAPQAG